MKLVTIIITSLVFSLSCLAGTKEQLADEYISLIKIREIYEASHSSWLSTYKQQTDTMLKQVKENVPDLPNEISDKMLASMNRFMERASNSWTVDGTMKVYQAHLVEYFTESELKELVDFTKSDIGKKSTKSSQIAVPLMQKYIGEASSSSLEKEYNNFLKEIRAIMKDYIESLDKSNQSQ
ncbi:MULTISPECIES: DUF2059 domain-containing protein [unclassified Lentimonas]|uniref:DUF2059 domain-containing protein n=1 Tax=unclassified Lentimonas TaxID=2630993 RepID=UPI00132A77F5|nr:MULTISPECIES: DUF2059 domain-containing protein [unclassified Lentimonas]CAA6677691.1 Unannotated [Lentimonas sp. CC4]CAA6684954.1 Unannotated [Lentimonas sp. CC6]CAA7077932.1 Unannotated [Lentimonas sp. CC4]CAA7169855.1 Unannotated [Lentimonas sp. CC21]CAA7179973.1 Unannotated [Lentimonas sp. CC8]